MNRAIPCLLAALLLAPAAVGDELRLKDGTKIVGNIVGYEGDSFKVETSYGFALVKKDKVASIVISEPKPEAKKSAPVAEVKKPAAEPKPQPPAKETKASAAITPPAPSTTASAATAPKVPPAQPKAAEAPAVQPPKPAAEPPMREELESTRYTNYTYGFRLYKPPSWGVIEGARTTLPTAIVAMGTGDQTTLFIVGREPLRQTIEQHAAATERRLREIYENYRPMDEKRGKVAGIAAIEKRFRGTVEEHDWSVVILTFARDKDVFTILGMTYADSDLIQIQENVIARTISSLEFIPRQTP